VNPHELFSWAVLVCVVSFGASVHFGSWWKDDGFR
jgi:hypothetical protein